MYEMYKSETSVKCSKVASNCLAKVVEFLNHHDHEPMKKINTPLIDHTFEGVVKQQWYRDYVEVYDQLLSEMYASADFNHFELIRIGPMCLAPGEQPLGTF